MNRPLAGLRVAYAAMEGFPNRKGSGVRVGNVVSALAEAGAEVLLLTLRGERGAPALPPGVTHRPLAILEDNYLARALAFRARVAEALYAWPADVIHVRGPFEGEAALEHANARRARFVFEVNGLPSVELFHHHPKVASAPQFLGKLRAREEHLMRAADLVLTQSQATARFLRLRAARPLPLAVVPNGADPALFAAPAAPARSGPMRVLYAGSLAPWQGLLHLLAAAHKARREVPLELVVVGPSRRAWTRAVSVWARRHKVQDILQLEAAVDQPTLARHLAEADVGVAPLSADARNRKQGCSPIKLFEYMAAGRAVAASDLPCVREIVVHADTGLLFKPSHPGRLAEALVALAAEPDARRRLGQRARRFVEAEATWAHRRAAVVSAYEALLAPRSLAYSA
ncbi:MAG: glycosyltransferase [Myxococcales bacterium]|nr:glycosyltransferase [Myxococcales bacterium]